MLRGARASLTRIISAGEHVCDKPSSFALDLLLTLYRTQKVIFSDFNDDGDDDDTIIAIKIPDPSLPNHLV